jgi:hypothetical protein
MKNGTDKRISVYLEGLREGVNRERLFRALSLILSEEDLRRYLSVNRDIEHCSDFDERSEESEVLAENIANS